MPTLEQLRSKWISAYTEDDAKYAEKANRDINEHFDKMQPSKSKSDPNRLGTRSNFFSKLRHAILDKLGPIEIEPATTEAMKRFNEMNLQEQLRYQATCRRNESNKWVWKEQVMPANLVSLGMSRGDKQQLFDHRAKVDGAKLRAELEEIDCRELMKKLCPSLDLSTHPKRHELAAALLLVTGRRTIEILSTADFKLAKDQTSSGYECIFTGQAKAGLDGDAPYNIPLLAPFSVVRAALDKIRELYPTEGMKSEEINQAYATNINNVTKRRVGLTPHELRAVYAMATYDLAKKKPSIIGWIATVLGHSKPSNATFYQRVKVVNAALWTGTPEPVVAEVKEDEEQQDDNAGWVVNGKVEQKRLAGIKEMMDHRIPMTATSIRANAGGTMAVAARIIEKNREKSKHTTPP